MKRLVLSNFNNSKIKVLILALSFMFSEASSGADNLVSRVDIGTVSACDQKILKTSARVVNTAYTESDFQELESSFCEEDQDFFKFVKESDTHCSATFIAEDLVLTNTHCLGSKEEIRTESAASLCSKLKFVINRPDNLNQNNEKSYECKEILFSAHEYYLGLTFGQSYTGLGPDFSVIRTEKTNLKNFLNFGSFGSIKEIKKLEEAAEEINYAKLVSNFVDSANSAGEYEKDYVSKRDMADFLTEDFLFEYGYSHNESNVDLTSYANFILTRSDLLIYGYPLGANLISSKLSLELERIVVGHEQQFGTPIYKAQGFTHGGMSGSPVMSDQCDILGVMFGSEKHDENFLDTGFTMTRDACLTASYKSRVNFTPSETILKVLSLIQSGLLVVADHSKLILDNSRYRDYDALKFLF